MTSDDAHPSQITHSTDRVVLRIADACAEAGISTRTLRRLREAGRGPRVIRLSERCLGVRRADLNEWLATRESA